MVAVSETEAPDLSMRCSSTRTRPARIMAWARSREAARLRSTRSLSRRSFMVGLLRQDSGDEAASSFSLLATSFSLLATSY